MVSQATLTMRDRHILAALSESATPSVGRVHKDPERVARAEALVADLGDGAVAGFRALLQALEHGTRAVTGRPFTQLARYEQEHLLERLSRSELLHLGIYALTAPLKYVAARDPEVFASVGATFRVTPVRAAPEAWERQIVDLGDCDRDEAIECDVVIVGTGAGGAPLARGLAARGYAVVLLEEGGHHTRRDFDGNALGAVRSLYRGGGTMAALGNAAIPLFMGKTTGGSTTVNSGTCFRTPDDVLAGWSRELGVAELSPERLAPHFESVERALMVAPSPMEVLGGNARVVARGASRLGWEHAPLPRNAPGCDGQGVCVFGCPTDAKRSTLVSYLPRALQSGAMMFTGARVDRMLTRAGRAHGVIAEARREDGRVVRLRVESRVVVVSGGAVPTPVLLLRNGLANGSGEVGRNLSLHPASFGLGRFEERIDGFRAVPQGYGVHAFRDRGLMLEGLFVPPDILAASTPRVGQAWAEVVGEMEHLAAFGFMIRDRSRGRVRVMGGKPLVTYWLGRQDKALVLEGHARVAEIMLAAGAREARPGVSDHPVLRSRRELERFVSEAPRRYRSFELGLSAYHPLGTCRMGSDPRRSVVRGDHRCHDVDGLYVVDGSVFPGPPGVNPQVTIMALAEQAVDGVARGVDAAEGRRGSKKRKAAGGKPASVEAQGQGEVAAEVLPAARTKPAWVFAEVMAGPLREVDEAVSRELVLRLDVTFPHLPDQLRCLLAGGGRLTAELCGIAELGGMAHGRPVVGHLTWAPLGGRAALVYEARFSLDDGTPVLLRGEKHVLLPRILRGATTLHSELIKDGTGEGAVLMRGVLRFDLWTMPSFLRSFRLKVPRQV